MINLQDTTSHALAYRVSSYITERLGTEQAEVLLPVVETAAEGLQYTAASMREAIAAYGLPRIFDYDARKSDNVRVVLAMLQVIDRAQAG